MESISSLAQLSAGDSDKHTVKSLYESLDSARVSALETVRDCAALTLPHLMPPEGYNETDVLPTPMQSMGARGVNNAASKLYLALFPPNEPFFKLSVDEATLQEVAALDEVQRSLGASDAASVKVVVEKGLASDERVIMHDITNQNDRPRLFMALKLLVVTGNALLRMSPDRNMGLRLYKLDRYVVERDGEGVVRRLIVKESINKVTFPDRLREYYVDELSKAKEGEPIDVYTHVYLEDDKYIEEQEIFDRLVPGYRNSYRKDELPWIALRWSYVDGNDYGRGLVEEYLGDLRTLEGLARSLIEASAAASKVVYLINPATDLTTPEDFNDAASGEAILGRDGDITTVSTNISAQMNTTLSMMENISNALAEAFLLNSSVQRDAERVTAYEVSFVARELETTLGGIYSVLSQDLQMPYVNIMIKKLIRLGVLDRARFDRISPVVTAGLEALGRGNDFNKLSQFLQSLLPIVQLKPDVLDYLNTSDLINRLLISSGNDPDTLVLSDQLVAQQRQQRMQQQQQMTQQQAMSDSMGAAAPGVANTITQGLVSGDTNPDAVRKGLQQILTGQG